MKESTKNLPQGHVLTEQDRKDIDADSYWMGISLSDKFLEQEEFYAGIVRTTEYGDRTLLDIQCDIVAFQNDIEMNRLSLLAGVRLWN